MSVFLYNERPLVTPSVRWGRLKQRTSDTEGWRGKARRGSTRRLPAEHARARFHGLTTRIVAEPFGWVSAALVG